LRGQRGPRPRETLGVACRRRLTERSASEIRYPPGCATPEEDRMTSNASPQPLKPGGHLPAGLPFSEGIAIGNLVLLSGQIGTFPGRLELNNATPEAESRQVMDNIVATLEANGMTA